MKAQGQFKSAIEQYQRVVALLEQIKSDSDLDIKRKASENYGFIYGELVDTYYLLSSEDVPNKLADADNALRYSELNKSRIFTNSWGRTFIDVLKLQLPTHCSNENKPFQIDRMPFGRSLHNPFRARATERKRMFARNSVA